jgi:UDP-N-acetylmuramoyl-tripeptide--D-alanyl-D-alanine ligase
MQPVRLPGGATVLRDDYSAAIDTLDAGLRVLERAAVTRRVLLVTDFSDFGKNRRHRLRHLARAAARSADMAVFVGESAAYLGRRAIEAGMAPERVHDFRTLEETARFLRAELGLGDLLLLKGRTTDHATRVFHALLGPIQCWKTTCRRRIPCDLCWELGARPADGLKTTRL